MQWAAKNENPRAARAAVECLLGAGADPGARDNKQAAPIHWAASNRNAEAAVAVVKILCRAGADITATCGVASGSAYSPWAKRLATDDVEDCGRAAKRQPAYITQGAETVRLLACLWLRACLLGAALGT